MSFKYHPAPKSGGGFTTRAALGPEFDEAAVTAAVAAATGVPADKCPLVFQEYFRQFLTYAANGCCWSNKFLGTLRIQPSSGGSATLPTDFHTADDIRADVSLSYSPDVIEDWRATLTLESMGEVGLVTPVIETIINSSNDTLNTYSTGGIVRVRGNNLKFTKSATAEGLFLKPAAGAEVRCSEYGLINPTEVQAVVPAGLSGTVTARFAATINGTLRSYTYTTPLLNP